MRVYKTLTRQQATSIFPLECLYTFNSIIETYEEIMPNFTLQLDFSSSSTSEDVNESAVNEKNISHMPDNRATKKRFAILTNVVFHHFRIDYCLIIL